MARQKSKRSIKNDPNGHVNIILRKELRKDDADVYYYDVNYTNIHGHIWHGERIYDNENAHIYADALAHRYNCHVLDESEPKPVKPKRKRAPIEGMYLTGGDEDMFVIIGGHFNENQVWHMFPDHKFDYEHIKGVDRYGYMRYEYVSEDMAMEYDMEIEPGERLWIYHDEKVSGIVRKATVLDIGDDE